MRSQSIEPIQGRLSNLLGVLLEEDIYEHNGVEYPALRLAQPRHDLNTKNELFSIICHNHIANADVTLVTDYQAGYLIREIQHFVADSVEIWEEIISTRPSPMEIEIRVNEEILDFKELPKERWKSLEINAKVRFAKNERNHEDQRLLKIIECAVVCLSLILSADVLQLFDKTEESIPEGARSTKVVNKYERSPLNRLICLQHFDYQCWVCDMRFEEVYKGLGNGFMEVHHVVPVSKIGENYQIKPKEDLVPLCSNCHSMIHWPNQNIFRSPTQLRKILQKPNKEENPFAKWDNYE